MDQSKNVLIIGEGSPIARELIDIYMPIHIDVLLLIDQNVKSQL